MIEFVFPWPPKELNPNWRGHWTKKREVVKIYRRACGFLTLEAKARVNWDGDVHAWIDFYPPNKIRRDDDNVFSSFKAGRDGMCDALFIDDNRIRSHPWLKVGEIGGMVKVRLTKGPENA